jgi:flagellar hook-length control protein FliK
MPNMLPIAAATPGLPTTLLTVAPAPALPGAAVEGGDFAAVIGGIAGDPMMLDLPPTLPSGGTNLPLPRPVFANQPAPLPPVEVEEVMVGCGWQPELRLGKGAEPVPQLTVPPVKHLPVTVPPQSEGVDTVQAPEPGLKPWTLHTSSAIALSGTALMIDLPDCEMPVPADALPVPVAEEPAEKPEPVATAPVIILPATPLPVPPVPTPVAAATAQQPADTEDAEQLASRAPQTGHVVLARRGGPSFSVAHGAQPAMSESHQEQPKPDQGRAVLPELPSAASPRATAAVASAPARADISIPPELARQVAQLIRPTTPETSTVAPTAPIIDQPVPLPQVAPAAPAAGAPANIASQPAPVDLGRSEWLQAMIDRIGDIAQEDGRREAQIKLLPSALGAVSVKIVERDERMHVTLTSDNAQARQLLSDAAPRLQELAEARGLRFAQADIGGGQPHDRRPAPDQQPQASLRPRPAAPEPDAQSQPDGDLIA